MSSYLRIFVFLTIVEVSAGRFEGVKQPIVNESKYSELQTMMTNQERIFQQKMTEMQALMQNQERILQRQITDLMDKHEHDRTTFSLILTELQNKVASVKSEHLSRNRKAVDPTVNVAFTAIMNNDMTNIGETETIIFDHPLLNLGNHYNKYTGVFTVPVDGIYSLTFFIGIHGSYEIYADLTVNNNLVVSAATEGDHDGQENQGGNSAIIHLSAGDVVQVKHHTYGSYVESGDHGAKVTTFSGFLIFPQESEPVSVIGK